MPAWHFAIFVGMFFVEGWIPRLTCGFQVCRFSRRWDAFEEGEVLVDGGGAQRDPCPRMTCGTNHCAASLLNRTCMIHIEASLFLEVPGRNRTFPWHDSSIVAEDGQNWIRFSVFQVHSFRCLYFRNRIFRIWESAYWCVCFGDSRAAREQGKAGEFSNDWICFWYDWFQACRPISCKLHSCIIGSDRFIQVLLPSLIGRSTNILNDLDIEIHLETT